MQQILKHLILIITVISLNLINPGLMGLAIENVDWFLLKENNDGKEWIDIGSIKNLGNNELSVLTKYFENPSETKSKGETNLYVMRINCTSREYKDISINGILSFNPKWKSSNNDELIDVVMDKSCSELKS
tara:strand:+ start:1864 stop:2256 length:393 start_codon:yes stop_codon:yes gene_type:complete